MPNFELVPGEYADLPDFLIRSVPGFGTSPEFALVADCFDLPGVIVGALRSFLERLDTASRADDFDASSAASLEAVYRVIEAMASSGDPEVQNAVVVEIFEHLQEDQSIRENLHPLSRALYERWIV